MTAGQHIDYDALALEALRGVVRACLAQVARTGLLGDHHFYIAFNTLASGVGMSKRLREKYPQEMTIVLQHRFWDLSVEDERFEVKLTFDGIPERLVIPFKAIKVFYDPSVPYGLQFEETNPNAAPDAARKSTRRAIGLAKDSDPRFADGQEGQYVAGQADPDAEPAEAGERNERRRQLRRSKPLHPAQPRPVGSVQDSGKAGGEEAEAGAPPAQRRDDVRPDKPVRLAPQAAPEVPAKPAALAAVAKADPPVDKPRDAAEPDADAEKRATGSGAQIFDLSKFRTKK